MVIMGVMVTWWRMRVLLQKYEILRQPFIQAYKSAESEILNSWQQTLLSCDSFFFNILVKRSSGSWFFFFALLSESVLSPRGSSDLLLSSVSDRPFNLKVGVKKKFKVTPRNQSTVALIKPHYLIFIFHPATLSPSGWLIWLAARVEEPRTVTWISVTF